MGTGTGTGTRTETVSTVPGTVPYGTFCQIWRVYILLLLQEYEFEPKSKLISVKVRYFFDSQYIFSTGILYLLYIDTVGTYF